MAKTDAYETDFDRQDEGSDRTAALKERFAGFGDSASSQIDNNPLIALGAGVALGAVLAAVLPASRKEQELLAPIGSKINAAGSGAIDRGRDLAKQKFDEMAGDKLREFIGANGSTASSKSE